MYTGGCVHNTQYVYTVSDNISMRMKNLCNSVKTGLLKNFISIAAAAMYSAIKITRYKINNLCDRHLTRIISTNKSQA